MNRWDATKNYEYKYEQGKGERNRLSRKELNGKERKPAKCSRLSIRKKNIIHNNNGDNSSNARTNKKEYENIFHFTPLKFPVQFLCEMEKPSKAVESNGRT